MILLISEYGSMLSTDEGFGCFPLSQSMVEVSSRPRPDKGIKFIHPAKSMTKILLK
jgi:hypothetical protein